MPVALVFGVQMVQKLRESSDGIDPLSLLIYIFRRYMNIFISTWVLLVAGLICAFPMIYIRIRDTTDMTDESL